MQWAFYLQTTVAVQKLHEQPKIGVHCHFSALRNRMLKRPRCHLWLKMKEEVGNV